MNHVKTTQTIILWLTVLYCVIGNRKKYERINIFKANTELHFRPITWFFPFWIGIIHSRFDFSDGWTAKITTFYLYVIFAYELCPFNSGTDTFNLTLLYFVWLSIQCCFSIFPYFPFLYLFRLILDFIAIVIRIVFVLFFKVFWHIRCKLSSDCYTNDCLPIGKWASSQNKSSAKCSVYTTKHTHIKRCHSIYAQWRIQMTFYPRWHKITTVCLRAISFLFDISNLQ